MRWTALAVASGIPLAASLAAGEPDLQPGLVVQGFRAASSFNNPRGIAIDPRWSEILVANTGDHRIEIFSLEGKPLKSFVHRVQRADGEWVEGLPRALALDSKGHLLVTDNLADYLDVLDFSGRSVARVAFPHQEGEEGPGAIAVTRAGGVLVATRGDSGRVHVLEPGLTWTRAWGAGGKAPGRLSQISGIAELPDGSVAVTCYSTEFAVQIFSPEGRYLRGFGAHEIGPGNFSLPSSIAATNDGRIWVSDELRQIVQVFDPSGSFLGAFGGGGTQPGNFLYPSALASDGVAHLAVAERVGGRFQLMRIR